jgi:uncharacterized protein (TIGR04255 family)
MSDDFLYERAPLVEVIAEVRWALKKVEVGPPDAQIDPYYDLFKEQFLEGAFAKDLPHRHELVPSAIPLELLPAQPRWRLRRSETTWPLVQIGPGILTVNIVPPYNGWKAFRPFLLAAVKELFRCYPLAERTLRISRLHLRYIDGFDERFGLGRYSEFIQRNLGIQSPLNDEFLAAAGNQNGDHNFLVQANFDNRNPPLSKGLLQIGPGQMNGKNAVIMELHCTSEFEGRDNTDIQKVGSWFDDAHEAVRTQFDVITTPALKEAMGARNAI